MESQDWDSAVVKPTVSASTHRLTRVFRGEPVVRVNGPAMVQEFIPEILVHGEWSLIFISGEFSLAALKLPTAGDFRVQSQFGGTANVGEPCAQMIDIATKIVDALAERPLYARVDGIEDERGFILMEVELIEPELFLGVGGASDRFAAKILSLPKMQVETRAKDEVSNSWC